MPRRSTFVAVLGCAALLAAPLASRGQGAAPVSPIVTAIPDSAIWDGRKIVPFKSLDNPPMVKASEAAAFLDDEEYVLGVAIDGEARAYPTRFLWWHHVINDKIPTAKGDRPFAVTYCSVCNTGLRFDTRGKGKTVMLDFFGLCNGVVALADRETESVFPQVTGKAVRGPLKGTELPRDPVLDTTWKEWKRLHPETLVMSPETEFKRFYRPKGQAEPRGHERFPAPFFQPTVSRGDLRLPPFEKVLAVTFPVYVNAPAGTEPTRRAYPIKAIRDAGGVVNDTIDGRPVAVFLEQTTTTALAVHRELDKWTFTFYTEKLPTGEVGIFDKETGSRWNMAGKAEAGPLKGRSLNVVENHLSQWYGWAAFFPETSIYGSSEAPKPGNPFQPNGK